MELTGDNKKIKRFEVRGEIGYNPKIYDILKCVAVEKIVEDNTMEPLIEYCDLLNWAHENKPEPEKTVEDFLAMSDEELNDAVNLAADVSLKYTSGLSKAWDILVPEINDCGFWIKFYNFKSDTKCSSWFTLGLFNGKPSVCGLESSPTVTLRRFICACFCFVKQEESSEQ